MNAVDLGLEKKKHSSCSVERDGKEQKQEMAWGAGGTGTGRGGGRATTVAQARDDGGSPAWC